MLIPTGQLFPDSHILVLNKFAVVPEHFILATRAFKEQTHLLEEADLRIAYACIEAYHAYHQQQHRSSNPVADSTPETEEEEEDGGLFVYFNSGPHSGASQPHRHLQLLPVAQMKQGLEPEHKGGKKWGVLADELSRDAELREARVPFQTFAEPIHPGTDLRAVYLRLYREACEAVLGAFSPVKEVDAMLGVDTLLDGSLKDGGKDGEETTGVEAKISYNLAMTRHVMVIMPRVAEGETVFCPSSSSAGGIDGYGGVGGTRKPIGKLALNGTVLAGTALVKSQAEWDALRAEPEQLLEILGRIGVPTVQASSPLPREGVPLYGGLDGQGQGRS
jgi:ATP adenylyltransferase